MLYPAKNADGDWGFIDATGAWVVQPQYEWVASFSEDLAAVLGDQYGFIARDGAVAIPLEFSGVDSFSEGLAAVFLTGQNGNRWGYIDQTGAVVIEPRFNAAEPFSEGLAVVRGEAGLGYIDQTGAWVIEPRSDYASSFSEGLAAVWLDSDQLESGHIARTVALAVPPRPVGKWGYVDRSGSFVIEPQFDTAGDFSEGLAAVQVDAGWGYIDQTGAVVIEPRFKDARPFAEGLAAVWSGLKRGYIDQDRVVRHRAAVRRRWRLLRGPGARRGARRTRPQQVGLHRQDRRLGHRAAVWLGPFVLIGTRVRLPGRGLGLRRYDRQGDLAAAVGPR